MNHEFDSAHCSIDLFQRVISLESTDAESLLVESHLDSCTACQSRLEAMVAEEALWNQAGIALSESGKSQLKSTPSLDSVSIEINCNIRFPEFVESVHAEPDPVQQHSLLLDPPSQPDTLGRIGGFAVEKLIGRGGMGVVYKGFDAELNRPVAIKFLAPHLASSEIARKRFARESKAAAAVVHPNVVPIYSVDGSNHGARLVYRPYIVMAWVSGRSLQTHVSQHGSLSIIDTVRIAQQIAAGLAAAHEQGIVHRDIKPANILLEKVVCRVLITDFGLARAADEASLTQSGWLAGTPHYMSPEQAIGDPVDARSDLFSLGSTMYFMLTGVEPFRADKPFAVLRKIASLQPEPIRSINSKTAPLLEAIVMRLLSKDPGKRFESAEETQQFLTHYLAHLQNPKTYKRPRLTGVSTKRRTVMSAIALTLAVIATAGYFLADRMLSPTTTNQPKAKSTFSNGGTPQPILASTLPPLQPMQSNQADRLNGDIQDLKSQLDRLESQTGFVPHTTVDLFDTEKQSLKQALEQFERSF